MTAAQVPELFERVVGCEVRELVAWRPAALTGAQTTVEHAAHRSIAHFSQGTPTQTWQVLAPRRIGLLQMPQLRASFCYVGARFTSASTWPHSKAVAEQAGAPPKID